MTSQTLRDDAWRGEPWHGEACRGEADLGRVDGREPGFDSPATRAPQGWAGLGKPGLGQHRQGTARQGAAGNGSGGWQPSGFDAPTPAPRGWAGRAWARQVKAWQSLVWQCSLGLGMEGGWQAPRFEPSAPALHGQARLGAAGFGSTRLGEFRSGSVRPGMAWVRWADGRSAGSTPAPSPLLGVARSGLARQGVARRCRAALGPATAVDHGLAPWSSPASGRASLSGLARYGDAGRGAAWDELSPVTAVDCVETTQSTPATRQDSGIGRAWRGLAWYRVARQGAARLSREPVTAVGREIVSRPSAAPGQHVARQCSAGRGISRFGKARQCSAGPVVAPVTAWGWGLVPQSWTAPGQFSWRGAPRRGTVWRGWSRRGMETGGRSSARFDSAPPTSQGVARRSKARQVAARQGQRGRLAHLGVRSSDAHQHGVARNHHFYLEFRMFEVKGDQAEWRMIYAEALSLNVDDVIKYTDLDEILGRDFLHDRSPIYRAIAEMEKSNARTLANVRGVGYRVAAASEHEGLARAHHQRSRRQMRKAVNKATSADRAALTPDQRKRIDGLEMSLRQHAQMIRRLERNDEQRQAEIKSLRRDTSANVAELSERVDRLADLLERHGVKPEATT